MKAVYKLSKQQRNIRTVVNSIRYQSNTRRNVLIMGAAGRDFHNFNMKFRNNPDYDVKAFTANQIPGIDDRKYPAELCGHLYPDGIKIHLESELPMLIKKYEIDEVVFSYSDVSNDYVMSKAAVAMALGCNFSVLGKKDTQLVSKKPCISVLASRTGCGKSQTSRYIVEALKRNGLHVVALRHPMPYGSLLEQKVQRYAKVSDLDMHKCTIEEREEYEPYVQRDCVIYAGVDYEEILREAEKEADVILWDGGNNDMSFIHADLEVTVVDPHRPGHERSYYPGQSNVLSADVVIINKVDSAPMENIMQVRKSVEELNPSAIIVEAASPIIVENGEFIAGKRVLVVEDGPTLTHGGMQFGAGMVAAKKYGARTVDPRPYIKGTIRETFEHYPEIGCLLPAMGYGDVQVRDLQDTINMMADSGVIDAVVSGTPIDLSNVVDVSTVPVVKATYNLQCIGHPILEDIIQNKLLKKD